jgi:hypothetical protein
MDVDPVLELAVDVDDDEVTERDVDVEARVIVFRSPSRSIFTYARANSCGDSPHGAPNFSQPISNQAVTS